MISGVGYDDHTVSACELHVWTVSNMSNDTESSSLREIVAAATSEVGTDEIFKDPRWLPASMLPFQEPSTTPGRVDSVSSNMEVPTHHLLAAS
jgi:hypothetical protein